MLLLKWRVPEHLTATANLFFVSLNNHGTAVYMLGHILTISNQLSIICMSIEITFREVKLISTVWLRHLKFLSRVCSPAWSSHGRSWGRGQGGLGSVSPGDEGAAGDAHLHPGKTRGCSSITPLTKHHHWRPRLSWNDDNMSPVHLQCRSCVSFSALQL